MGRFWESFKDHVRIKWKERWEGSEQYFHGNFLVNQFPWFFAFLSSLLYGIMLKVELSLTVKTDDVTSSRRDVEFCAWVFTFGSGANGLTEAYALSHLHFLCERLLSSNYSLPITFLLICPSNPKNNLLNSPSFSLFCLVLFSFLGNCYNQPNIIKIYWSKTKIRT